MKMMRMIQEITVNHRNHKNHSSRHPTRLNAMTLILQEEYPLLYDMLKRNALVQSTDPDDRESMLHACGFSTLADKLQLGKPADAFTANLITKLEKMKGQDKPPLVRFLENYSKVYPNDVDEEDKALIRGIVDRWETGRRPTETTGVESADPEAPIRLDKAVMSRFDLETLTHQFREKLDAVEGVFGFSVGHIDHHMLEHYILDRLMREYWDKTDGKPHRPISFCMKAADADSGGGAEIIRQEIVDRLRCRGREWFQNERNAGKDLIVCIWNRCLPDKDMENIASSYMKHAVENLSPALRFQRLILIWIGFTPVRIKKDEFTVLELPTQVPTRWMGWFREWFLKMTLNEDIVEHMVRRLERHSALDDIYNEFRFIMEELREGPIAQ
jgi:hypothetical protein